MEPGHHKYEVTTFYEKMVADYLRIPVAEVENLGFVYYLRARRDAFITRLDATEAGRAYLDEAWRLGQTEPDREASREAFGHS